MERAMLINFMYDPDRLIDLRMFSVPSQDTKLEVAQKVDALVAHNAEEVIKKIEELKRIGFDHIIFNNMSMDGELGVKVFKDVLPHVV
jgi:hypothetical protein